MTSPSDSEAGKVHGTYPTPKSPRGVNLAQLERAVQLAATLAPPEARWDFLPYPGLAGGVKCVQVGNIRNRHIIDQDGNLAEEGDLA